jgi:hypothetical protein
METIEKLAPYAFSVHLNDRAVAELSLAFT